MKARTMALGVAVLLCGCALLPSEKVMPEHPDYLANKDKVFALKTDVCLLDATGNRGHPALWICGRPLTVEEVKTNIGKTINGIIILALVQKGTKFQVERLRWKYDFEMGDELEFDLRIEGEAGRKWPSISSGSITKFMPREEPKPGRIHFKPDLVEEVK